MIKFLLLVNKQRQPRIVQHYEYIEKEERLLMETAVIKNCLSRNEKQCQFFEYKNMMIVYRKYATLYFIVGIDHEENELAILEFIHNIVETFDRYFDKVCELDRFSTRDRPLPVSPERPMSVEDARFYLLGFKIMFNLDKVHMILNEMILNGRIVESNKTRILAPIQVMEQASKR